MLRLLSQAEVCAKLGIDPSTLWSWYKSGHFPAPIVLGPGDGIRTTIRWREDEVDAWIESRPRGWGATGGDGPEIYSRNRPAGRGRGRPLRAVLPGLRD